MKRGTFKRKKPLKRVIAEYRKPIKKGWQPPSWVGVIPQGSHGSTKIQKKAWKLISDYVRIHDYYTYGGKCAACGKFFEDWRDGHCGHFKSWGASNSYAKYYLKNLALICPYCNQNENAMIGFNFGQTLMDRHGIDVIYDIEDENNNRRGQKMEDFYLVGMMEVILPGFERYPGKPDYYDKMMERYEEHSKTL